MLSNETLLNFAEILRDLPLSDVAELFSKSSARILQSGEIYINRHENNKLLAYIEKGIIRAYTHKDNGYEATLLLRWENQFIGSHDSILLNQPSNFIYQALEETHILEIDYCEVEQIMTENPKYELVRNHVLMSMLSASLKMIEDFILLNPEERYKKLLLEKFDIVNRVPDKHIASMLGITPVSLSRIRRRMTKY
jgi:CRP-like cAMP-binding protein